MCRVFVAGATARGAGHQNQCPHQVGTPNEDRVRAE
jgi:hypothetical protein